MPLTLDDFSVYWPYRNAGEAAADNLTQPASPVQAQKNMEVIRDIFLASESSLDGRSIFEATPVVDAEEEFAPGGTFTLNRANLRHRAIKVSDGSNPLTAPMTVSLNPSDDWVAGDVVIITKGDSSDNNITVTGFDLDGLGNWTLKTEWDAVYCLVQSVDDSEVGTGQGPNQDIKFERVMRIRQLSTDDLAEVATTGDYNDLINSPALPPLDAITEDDVCGGTLTAAAGDVDLSGTDDGYVLTQDASGNLSFEAPSSTASGVEFDGDPVTELVEGSNITFAYSSGVLTLNVSSGSATVGDGDYGDIVVSGTGTTYTIDTGVVTNAKMADMAEATFKMRADGAGTGVPIDGTAAQARTALNVADGATANTGALADLDTVDTAQIDDGAVTVAKVSDLASYSVILRASGTTGAPAAVQAATDTLLGRGSSGNLGFRQLTNDMVPDDEIDPAKLSGITEFSDDGELLGNSATTIVSERAIGEFVSVEIAEALAGLGLNVTIAGTYNDGNSSAGLIELTRSDTYLTADGTTISTAARKLLNTDNNGDPLEVRLIGLPSADSPPADEVLVVRDTFVFDRPAIQTGAVTIRGPDKDIVQSGGVTSGSAVVTGLSSTAYMQAGDAISGTNIPASTTILSVDSATQVTMSANATGTGTVSITVTVMWALIHGSQQFTAPTPVGDFDNITFSLTCFDTGDDSTPPSFFSSERAFALLEAAREKINAVGNTSGALTIDLNAGPVQTMTLTGNVSSSTFSNRPADGFERTVILRISQDGTGSRTWSHPTGTKTIGGAALPALSTAASSLDELVYTVVGQSGDIYVRSALDWQTP